MNRVLRVLIASELSALARSLAEAVRSAGHRPQAADDYPTFAQVRETAPDLLLLDLSQSESRGLELLRRLVRHRLTGRIAVILLSPRPELEFEHPDAFDFLSIPPFVPRLRQGLALLAAQAPGTIDDPLPLQSAGAVPFQEFLECHTGLHFDRRNLRLLERGLLRRLRAVQAQDYATYFTYLEAHREDRGELKKLLSLLTVGETYFFRYRSDREALVQQVMPELLRQRQAQRSLRIWSAGCSTGEEPYSLAILLLEHFPQLAHWRIDLLATDINKRALRHARQGVYGNHALRLTAGPYREKYFREVGDGLFLLDERVRRLVRFAYLNLQEETFPSIESGTADVDLIFCRNVLIYFRRETTQRVVERLHGCLRPDGFLFLGHAESLNGMTERFQRVHQHGAFFYQPTPGPTRIATPELPSSPVPASIPTVSLPVLPKPFLTASGPLPLVDARSATPNCPGELSTRLTEARQAFNSEDFFRSEQLYCEILRHHPGEVEALVGMGLLHANRGRYQEARQMCARAIALDDLCPPAYLLRGLILDMEGEPERAAVEYQKVLWLDLKFVVARFYLAKVSHRLGRQEEAVREMRTVLRQVERLAEETIIPFSGGLSREVFLEICRDDLARLPTV